MNWSALEAIGSLLGGFATAATIFAAFITYSRRARDEDIDALRQTTARAVVLVNRLDEMLVEQNFTMVGVRIAENIAAVSGATNVAQMRGYVLEEANANAVNACVYRALHELPFSQQYEELLRELQFLSNEKVNAFPLIQSILADATRLLVATSKDSFSGRSFIPGLHDADYVNVIFSDDRERGALAQSIPLVGVQISALVVFPLNSGMQMIIDRCENILKTLDAFVRQTEASRLERLIRARRTNQRRLNKKLVGTYTGDIKIAAGLMRPALPKHMLASIEADADTMAARFAEAEDNTADG